MPKLVDADEERAAILDRCLDLFAREGYGLARMREVARAAGVSTGKLYHYFPDKRSIAAALFAHVARRDINEAEGRMALGRTRRDRLRQLGQFVTQRRDRLAQNLLLALDHRRVEGPHMARDALRAYRASLNAQVGGDDEILFTVLVGLLVRGLLDPDALDVDRHLAWIEGLDA